MKLLVKILLPLLVLAVSGWLARGIVLNPPQAERRQPRPPEIVVEAQPLTRQDYRVQIRSQGTVRPHTRGTLITQLAGQVTEVADSFREGGFFAAGETLLRIDPRDYQIAVTVAEAELARAEAAAREERARAEAAASEWRQLNRGREANELVLRKPQLAAALAATEAARAQLAKAELDLQRTRIQAPYAGRVMSKNVAIGQYVTRGTVLAEIYASDYLEVRLPLTNRQLGFVDLPEGPFRDGRAGADTPAVTLSAVVGRREQRWQGRVVRVASTVDTASRQLYVIAQIDNPYGQDNGGDPALLRVGQFVNAVIEGELLENVIVVPRAALAEGDELLLVDADGRLQRRRVAVVWSDARSAVLADGALTDDHQLLLSLTPLPGVLSGTPVTARVGGKPVETAARPPAARPPAAYP